MAAGNDVDILFDVRNHYYLGAYQQCINEAQNVKTRSEELAALRDAYLYRAYIALNKLSVAISEIRPSEASVGLRSIRRFAEYQASEAGSAKRKALTAEIDTELASLSPVNEENEEECIHLLMMALVMMHEERIDDALKVLSNTGSSGTKSSWLECRSGAVQCLLKINRVDLAMKEVKKMQEVDEDNTLTQLSLAWVNMTAGKDKLRDAFYILQEMIDKYGATTSLLVSQSACLIQQQKYDEAERLLQDALHRDMNNAELLINLVVLGQFTGKSTEVTNRYVNQLKSDHSTHAWTKDYTQKERDFERLVHETSA